MAWPVALLNTASFIDSPWSVVESRAADAGIELANALLRRQQGNRPVTLVGYSLGCVVIAKAAEILCGRNEYDDDSGGGNGGNGGNREEEEEDDKTAKTAGGRGRGLIRDVVLVGCTFGTSGPEWKHLREATSGRVVNAYLGDDRDWMLRFVRRASSLAVTEGLAAWSEVKRDGIENVEVGGVCGGGAGGDPGRYAEDTAGRGVGVMHVALHRRRGVLVALSFARSQVHEVVVFCEPCL